MKSKVLVISGLLLVTVVISAFSLYQSKLPQRSGSLQLAGLEQTITVHFDEWGIPHIYATHYGDAQIALGYLHAQERFFQMDLLRRVGSGRMAELFGERAIKADIFFRTLGIADFANWFVENRIQDHPELMVEIEHYLSGVNQYLALNPQPIEYDLLQVEPEPFELKDIITITGYMAYTFAQAYKTDPVFTYIKEALGDEYLAAFNTHWPDYAPTVPTTALNNSIAGQNLTFHLTPNKNKVSSQNGELDFLLAFSDEIKKISHQQLPVGLFQGSNSWIVSGKHTTTGKPLFANDPHISFAAPSTWFEAHINTPNYEIYGHFLAGIPYPILGHNQQFSYGMTMWENDDVDFYFETLNADKTQVLHKNQWVDLVQQQETIKVKDGEPHNFTITKTPHGPLINGLVGKTNKDTPVSLFWTFTDKGNNPIQGIAQFSKVKDITEFEQAVAKHWSPGLNINYADVEGNIAMWTAGRIPHRPVHTNSFVINDGATGDHDILGYLDFSHNPRTVNPKSGIIYSANHPYSDSDFTAVAGYYVPEDRAIRLEEVLSQHQGKFTVEVFKNLQNDIHKYRVPIVLAELTNTLTEEEQESPWFKLLQSWDQQYKLDQIAPTVFERFYYQLNAVLFTDELGKKGFSAFKDTHMVNLNFISFLQQPNSIWWDNIETQDKTETATDMIKLAWQKTLSELEKVTDQSQLTWREVHTIEHSHPLGRVDWLRGFFNVGPKGSPGSRETLNNMYHPVSRTTAYIKAGPSTRRIIDLANPSYSWGINPTGNSGVPIDQHYEDQFDMHIAGEYRPQLMQLEEILTTKASSLTILPTVE